MNKSWTARPEHRQDDGYQGHRGPHDYPGHHAHDSFPGHHGHYGYPGHHGPGNEWAQSGSSGDAGEAGRGNGGTQANNTTCDMQGNDGTSSDPAPQTVRFADDSLVVAKSEGDAGATAFTFKVERLGGTDGDLDFTVELTSAAASSADFVGSPALPLMLNCTIPDGQSSATVTVNVNGDTAVEVSEDFTLTITSVTNAEASAAIDADQDQATGRILTDDFAGNEVGAPIATTGPIDCGAGNTQASNNTSPDPADNGGPGSGGNTAGNGGSCGTAGNPGTPPGDAHPNALISVDVASGDKGLNATADLVQHDGDAAHHAALISADVNVGPDVDATASLLNVDLADVNVGLDFGHDIGPT